MRTKVLVFREHSFRFLPFTVFFPLMVRSIFFVY